MRRIYACALAVLALAGLGVHAVAAQSAQRFSVQASGLYIKLFGTAFDSLSDGVGGEIQLRYTAGAWSLGGGVQYTKHDRGGSNTGAATNTARLLGFFVEPRYTLPVGSSRVAPYLSARLALSNMTLKIVEGDYDASGGAPGPTINGGGGVLVRLARRINLDVGATFGYTKYGDLEYTSSFGGQQSQTAKFPLGSGTNVVLRAGLAIGLGG